MTQGNRILLVDDEKSIALVLKGVIRDLGYDVVIAYSGEEALETLKNSAFDLMITDIKMPGMDGFDLLHIVQDAPKYAEMKLAILTAFNDRQAIERSKKEFGIKYYITKPFDLKQIESAIMDIMRSEST